MGISRVQDTSGLTRDYRPPGGTPAQRVIASKTGMAIYDSVLEAANNGAVTPTPGGMESVSPTESHKVFGRSFVIQRFNGRV
jgi:hypothetical protein